MGPYYRDTSQSMGAFFDAFYQHPSLMLVLVFAVVSVGFLVWRKSS